MEEERLCAICGKILTKRQKYVCSVPCNTEYRSKPKLICKACGQPFPYKSDNGVPRSYCCKKCFHADRNAQYQASTKTERWCCYCHKHLPLDNFSSNKVRACRECTTKKSRVRINDSKANVIKHLGGKCTKCGYDKCDGALDLHHTDVTLKVTPWNKVRSWSYPKILQWIEDEKVILLCSNCHREEHFYNDEFRD